MTTTLSLGPKRDVGQQFEQMALVFLREKGLKPVTQNFTCKTGEIDLIMLEGSIIVFVEVRYRKKADFMSAVETITFFKQQKLRRTAEFFLAFKLIKFWLTSYTGARFDVITIEGAEPDVKIAWIKNAF